MNSQNYTGCVLVCYQDASLSIGHWPDGCAGAHSIRHQTAVFDAPAHAVACWMCDSCESHVHRPPLQLRVSHREHCKTDGPDGESLAAGVAVGRLYDSKNAFGQGLRVVGARAAHRRQHPADGARRTSL